jgi:hypothetical protein
MYHAVCKEYIPGGDKMNNDQIDEYAATWSPHNRVGQPIDIARVVAFLASQDGEWVNGKVIGIDGYVQLDVNDTDQYTDKTIALPACNLCRDHERGCDFSLE